MWNCEGRNCKVRETIKLGDGTLIFNILLWLYYY